MSEWRSIESAPKDGRIIEVENRYGYPWHRGLYRYRMRSPTGWYSASDDRLGLWDGALHACRWRTFHGCAEKYRDPYAGFDAFAFYCGRRPWARLLAAFMKRSFQKHARHYGGEEET